MKLMHARRTAQQRKDDKHEQLGGVEEPALDQCGTQLRRRQRALERQHQQGCPVAAAQRQAVEAP